MARLPRVSRRVNISESLTEYETRQARRSTGRCSRNFFGTGLRLAPCRKNGTSVGRQNGEFPINNRDFAAGRH